MDWIEINIYTTSEGIEVVGALLLENSINNFQIEDDDDMKLFLQNNSYQWDYLDKDFIDKESREVHIKFYVTRNIHGKETINYIENQLKKLKNLDLGLNLGRLEIDFKNVDDEDWINNWKKYYKPFKVGKKILIKPQWEKYDNIENRIIFNINPGHIFGTGLHQTTQLCIIELEKYINNDSVILDLGCGTGILSIIGLMLGAKSALAIDIDPNAIDIAYENASINNIDKNRYIVISGDILKDKKVKEYVFKNKYNVIVVNIIADVIIDMLEFIYRVSDNKSIFIASGIIKERVDDVCEALRYNKFKILNIIFKDDWVCIVSAIENL